ncbi:low-density lipoprotein receptor-related protein 4-like [Mytilus trossulus]|uniref:low-density lipoprotein receptor-related protein 4-like n=1 Tax=Mytilus trossulus TaxID=6551 RepID=UPI0030055217
MCRRLTMDGFQILFVLSTLFMASVNGCCWTHGGCFSTYSCCATYYSGPNLIVLDRDRIYLINMNESTVTKLVVDIPSKGSESYQIDYHQTKSYIYWLDPYYGTMHRTCYPCNDNERRIEEIIPKSTLYHPISFSIDSENDHIYWSDSSDNAVIRSNLDGSNKTVIIKSSSGIGHITLDVKNRWIYFMDDEIGTIERSNLDGNAKVVVISDSVMTKKSRILLGEYPIKAQYKYLLHLFLT